MSEIIATIIGSLVFGGLLFGSCLLAVYVESKKTDKSVFEELFNEDDE